MSLLGTRPAAALTLALACSAAAGPGPSLDRRALVDRHRPVLHAFDVDSPLTVGNGEFAFTADATGLQTFAEDYDATVPLGTLAQWGWHTSPNPQHWSSDRFRLTGFDAHGRRVDYNDVPGDRRSPEVEWLRDEPSPAAPRAHRLPADPRRRTTGARAGPDGRRTGARAVGRLAAQPLPAGGRAGGGRDARPPAQGPRRGAGPLAARSSRPNRDPPALSVRQQRRDWRRLDEAGGTRDAPRALRERKRRARAPPRRRSLSRRPRLGPGRPVEREAEPRARPRADRRRRRARGGDRVLADEGQRTAARLRRDARRGARALEPLLDDRRRDRPLAEQRPALARARAADRPVPVPHRDPVCRAVTRPRRPG